MRPEVRGRVRHALAIVSGLAALAPLTSQGAFAQTIPSYGTHAHCQRLAGFGGTFSRRVYGMLAGWVGGARSWVSGPVGCALGVPARALRPQRGGPEAVGAASPPATQFGRIEWEAAPPKLAAVGGTARFYLVTSEGGQG